MKDVKKNKYTDITNSFVDFLIESTEMLYELELKEDFEQAITIRDIINNAIELHCDYFANIVNIGEYETIKKHFHKEAKYVLEQMRYKGLINQTKNER